MDNFMRLLKYFWILSLLAFLGIHLYVYIDLPNFMKILVDAEGRSEMQVGKSAFFYGSVFITFFINVVIIAVASMLPYLPRQIVWVPQKVYWLQSKSHRERLYVRTKGWSRGMAIILNFFLLVVTSMIISINSDKYDVEVSFLLYVVPVMLLVWLGFFFVLFNQTEEKSE